MDIIEKSVDYHDTSARQGKQTRDFMHVQDVVEANLLDLNEKFRG